MKVHILRELDSSAVPTVVTIGNFDGIHLGHRALIDAVIREAKQRQSASALVTFDPHPQEIIHPRRPVPRICTPELQFRLLEECGLDEVHVIPFTPELAELDAETFAFKFLVNRFSLEKLVVGYDFRFGKNRKGDFILLERLARERGFILEEIAPVRINGQIVSSTLIRQQIEDQHFDLVEQFLGRRYSLLGVVEKGEQRGRLLGFPTANLIPKTPLPLCEGVYVSQIGISGELHYGVTNIGTRPTFGEDEIRVETWIIDFDQDIYGKTIEVRPLKLLRPEKRFNGMKELKKQIKEDVSRAKSYLEREIHYCQTGNPC